MSFQRIPWLTLICLVLTAGVAALVAACPEWSQAWGRDWHVIPPLMFAGAAWLGGVSADPDRAPERQMQVASALLLLVALWLAPLWAERLQLGAGGIDELGWWLPRLAESLTPVSVALPASLVAGFSLFSLTNHPSMPRALTWLTWVGAVAWAVALMSLAGQFIDDQVAVPTTVYLIGLVLLPFQMRGASIYIALPLWLVCASTLVHLGMNALAPDGSALGWWMLGSLTLSLPVWATWLARIDAVARFDRLQEGARALKEEQERAEQEAKEAQAAKEAAAWAQEDHPEEETPPEDETPLARKRRLRREARARQFALEAYLESPEAQEGADKYTRE